MKTEIDSIMPEGYGHKKVTIIYTNGKKYSAVTNDMPTVDAYRTEVFTRKDQRTVNAARRALINIVKRRHSLR